MKNISKLIIGLCCTSTVLAGCIDETFPTNAATSDQLASSAKATEALLWAMPAYANKFNVFNSTAGDEYGFDWGYGSIMHIRDVMTEDVSIISSGYDHYTSWENNTYQGPSYLYSQFIWNYYWKFVQTSNNMISALDPGTATEVQLGYLGAGYAFRAFQYLDMAQMFEFLENDATKPVNTSGNNVLNLTVPIVKEGMAEEDARNNPRVTRQDMYEFILSDLNAAETYIPNLQRSTKTLPDLSVVYGLKARLYMWVGDYANAREYARKAIAQSGATPMTEAQWLSTTNGFNDLSVSSWMWGSQMQEEDDVVKSGILNWTSWLSNETYYGYAGAGPFSMISASLYDKIGDTDFRKRAWKAPAGSTLDGKNDYIYADLGEKLPEYASLKFRPASGNGMVSNVGSASAYPLMRVEEMYLIEAEAAAHLDAAQGKELLLAFMKYRDDTYTCDATGDELIEEIITQKRIELWGEGLTFFDIKRLNMPVTRGYTGTNFSELTRLNTTTRPAWMNICIVQTEENNNAALRGFENPDPSGLYTPWMPQ